MTLKFFYDIGVQNNIDRPKGPNKGEKRRKKIFIQK